MSPGHPEKLVVTAADARGHLTELEAERALAVSVGLGGVSPYMADLRREIEAWREAYVGAAVTEIATLRAELSGAQVG